MYLYVYIYMCVYIYIYLCVCIYIYIYTRTSLIMHTHYTARAPTVWPHLLAHGGRRPAPLGGLEGRLVDRSAIEHLPERVGNN